MADLITVPELQAHLQRKTGFSADILLSAESAIADATSIVSVYIRTDVSALTAPTTPQWKIDAAKGVCKRVAGRIFTNPDQRTSYTGPDGLNYSGGPVRVLTDDERAQLDPLVDYTGIYG